MTNLCFLFPFLISVNKAIAFNLQAFFHEAILFFSARSSGVTRSGLVRMIGIRIYGAVLHSGTMKDKAMANKERIGIRINMRGLINFDCANFGSSNLG